MLPVFPSLSRAPATYTKEFTLPKGYKGVRLDINYTAGTGLLDVKFQFRDSAEPSWEDLPGAAIVQMSGAAEIDLTVYPGLTAVANRLVTQVPTPEVMRVVAVVGTANATFNASLDYLQ